MIDAVVMMAFVAASPMPAPGPMARRTTGKERSMVVPPIPNPPPTRLVLMRDGVPLFRNIVCENELERWSIEGGTVGPRFAPHLAAVFERYLRRGVVLRTSVGLSRQGLVVPIALEWYVVNGHRGEVRLSLGLDVVRWRLMPAVYTEMPVR